MTPAEIKLLQETVAEHEADDAEIATLNKRKSDRLKAIKGRLDVAAVRQAIAVRRKVAQQGEANVEAANDRLDEYLHALTITLDKAPKKEHARTPARAREPVPDHDPETGEITSSAAVPSPSDPKATHPPVDQTTADTNSPADEPTREGGPTEGAAPVETPTSAAEPLPTVTLDDGTEVVPANLQPTPGQQATGSFLSKWERVIATPNRNRPRTAEYAQDIPPDDDPKIPAFLRRVSA